MRFINETNHQATLVRVSRGQAGDAAAAVVKSTYRIEAGRCLPSPRPHALLKQPERVHGAVFEPDESLRKLGVDVLVVGAALGLGPETRWMPVGLDLGGWVSQVLVFGERQWRRRGRRWRQTEPETFSTLPVTWAHAFGGVATSLGAPIPHMGNPHGKGYVLEPGPHIDGLSLPNIEDPEHLIGEPEDAPCPFGFSPLPSSSAIRVEAALDPSRSAGVDASIFNVAHPRHRLDVVHGKERCRLWGWTGLRDDEAFEIPRETLELELRVGRVCETLTPQIDTVCIFPEQRELVVTRRATFTYDYARGVGRVARLRDRADASTRGRAHG